ncbi:MAG: hypothetical protein IPL87_00345 [Candidatus Moraniibacteriota bacterium]|nr:MAG: hypothetical protein IPL87_00345 [Candidatus Moranbacteria bacterium]
MKIIWGALEALPYVVIAVILEIVMPHDQSVFFLPSWALCSIGIIVADREETLIGRILAWIAGYVITLAVSSMNVL